MTTPAPQIPEYIATLLERQALIVDAAPRMLTALKIALGQLEGVKSLSGVHSSSLAADIAIIKAAIAQATGTGAMPAMPPPTPSTDADATLRLMEIAGRAMQLLEVLDALPDTKLAHLDALGPVFRYAVENLLNSLDNYAGAKLLAAILSKPQEGGAKP